VNPEYRLYWLLRERLELSGRRTCRYALLRRWLDAIVVG
jgi:hypothetical protein